MNELGCAQVAAQRIVRLRDIEDQRVASADRRGERLERVRRRIEHEEARAGIEGGKHGRRHVCRRFCPDAFKYEVRLQHARKRRRLVDAYLGAGKRMLARLEDDAFVGADWRVARTALDLDEADLHVLLRRRW